MKPWLAFLTLTLVPFAAGCGSVALAATLFYKTDNLMVAIPVAVLVWLVTAAASGFCYSKLLNKKSVVVAAAVVYATLSAAPIGWAVGKYLLDARWPDYVSVYLTAGCMCAVAMRAGQMTSVQSRSKKLTEAAKSTLQFASPPPLP